MASGYLVVMVALLSQAAEAAPSGSETPPPVPDLQARHDPRGRPQVVRGSGPLPVMRFDAPVFCAELAPSREVPSGRYRIQCDDKAQQCLASSTHVMLDGVEGSEPLARVNDCLPFYPNSDHGRRVLTYRFVAAQPESPSGWFRDEEGRVMQVNFDLNRRVYLGSAYAPIWFHDSQSHRIRADFGIEVEFPSDDGHILNRLHLLEGQLNMGDGGATVSGEATLIRYDWSAGRQTPVLWLTTFIGAPHRFDLTLDLGGWLEALRLETIKRANLTTQSYLTLGSANLTLDVWHSRDLVSYVRLRAGPSVEIDLLNGFTTVKPMAAFDADLTLDPDGFHHLHANVLVEKLYFDKPVAGRPLNPERLKVNLGYEVILLAINDYPLSLVLDGKGVWRDDLVGAPAGWEWSAEAGLRFSFWAPARRKLEAQAPRG